MAIPINHVLFIGNDNCGKTSLITSLSQVPNFRYKYKKEEDHTLIKFKIAGEKLLLKLIEGESDSFQHYVAARVVVICFSIDSSVSFSAAKDTWFSNIRKRNEAANIILVGTKEDLRTDRNLKLVRFKDGKSLAEDINAFTYVECSSNKRRNLDKLLQYIAQASLKYMGEQNVRTGIVLGDTDTGKTSLLMTATKKTFPVEKYMSLDDYTIQSEDRFTTVLLCDTVGGNYCKRMKYLLYKEADAIIICFFKGNLQSVLAIENEVKEYDLKLPLILVGNMSNSGSTSESEFNREDGELLAKKVNAVAYVDCSSNSMDEVHKIFKISSLAVLEKLGSSERPSINKINLTVMGDINSTLNKALTLQKFININDRRVDIILGISKFICECTDTKYIDADIVIICFSVDSPKSLDNVETWAKLNTKKSPIILVGNKKDLRYNTDAVDRLRKEGLKPTTEKQGRRMAKKIKAVAYVECSAINRIGVQEVLKAIMNTVEAKKRLKLC